MKKLFIGTTSSNAAQPFHTSGLPDCKRFSSFTRLVRATAWVLRFVQVLRSCVRKQPVTFRQLTADELAKSARCSVPGGVVLRGEGVERWTGYRRSKSSCSTASRSDPSQGTCVPSWSTRSGSATARHSRQPSPTHSSSHPAAPRRRWTSWPGVFHEKCYGVLFTCMTTRAVHLEIAASLTTGSAISTVRRLISRRGKPKEIFSDNGTDFRGADAELRRALQVDADKLGSELAGRAITWRFNPPATPHMGGAWERLVRSMKVALRSQLKDSAPKEEVLHTFLCEAEAMVNSRPLTHVAIDADDEEALTPFHFLIGTSSVAGVAAPGVFTPTDSITRKQWRISQQMADQFWKRWLREYLPTLTRRTKWYRSVEPVEVNDVVM